VVNLIKKRSEKAKLEDKLDNRWSLIVRNRAKNRCEICGNTQNLNSHHIVTRTNKRLRWDLKNGVSLCVKHHVFGSEAVHENALFFDNWFIKHRKNDRKYLLKEMYSIKQRQVWELKELLETFDNMLKTGNFS